MTISVLQLLPLLFWTVLFAVPFFVLLPKAGMSRWWLLFLALPMFGAIILLWIVALSPWKAKPMAEVFS